MAASLSSKIRRRFVRAVIAAHAWIYRASRGRLGNRLVGMPVLLLTTTGRKTGRPHTNPLVFIEDGGDTILAASYGGMDWHPAWYLNLEKTPHAVINLGGQTFTVQVSFPQGEERDRLFERFKAASDNFVRYESRTERRIPVVRLRR